MKRFIVLSLVFFPFSLYRSTAQTNKPELFPLQAVRLLESPFKKAQETDAKYILSLDADRLLAPFLKDAGIQPVKESYGNWERTGLDGHTGGHYITAVAQMYAATGNELFKQKLDYFLNWLDSCQRKNGNGYVGGVPEGKSLWPEVAAGNVSAVRKRWVPWYNVHKTMSGLVDAYVLTGSAKAKDILMKLSDWCWTLTSKLSDEQMQEMLQVEHGGMNEVFVNVAVISGDKKYLELAKRFTHRAVLDPLMKDEDRLTGLHANTQIPKIVGIMRYASVSGDRKWAHAADFFWQTVVLNRSVAFGGNSVREHFNPTNDFSQMLESREGPESCNSYNMLKLTKLLFLQQPASKYIDYYERTLYNHILSTEHPNGGFVYFTPIRPNHYRVYSSPQQSFWCCVGTGIENHGKYGELIYAHTGNDLYINLFIPSVLKWKEKNIEIRQDNRFPFEDRSAIYITTAKPQKLQLKIRQPAWLSGAMVIRVNGKPTHVAPDEHHYISIDRTWKTGDSITIQLPMSTYAEALPDKSNWVAFLHGPVLLAAATDTTNLAGLRADDSRWGHIANGKIVSMDEAPLLVMDDIKKITLPAANDKALTFTAHDLIYQEKYKGLQLKPFYEVHDTRYIMYWPYTSSAKLPGLLQELKEKEDAKKKLDDATIDVVYTGEQQPESDHNFKGENTNTGSFKERHYRKGKGWFSYELRNTEGKAKQIIFTYYGNEKDTTFDLYMNNAFLTTITLPGNEGDRFLSKTIDLPAAAPKTISVMFKSKNGSNIPAIYEVRLIDRF